MTSYKNSEPRPPIMAGSPVPSEWRCPADDWDRPPWNRWSFQNIREILPTTQVRRGNGPIQALTLDIQDIGTIAFEASNGSKMSVAGMIDATYTDAFIVHAGGRIIHEGYYNGMTETTCHLAQSVTKSIVATVYGILAGRGMLDRNAPVTEHLPELANTGWQGCTLQHVLDMTSGVAFEEEYTSPASDIGITDVASGWKPVPADADPEFVWPGCVWDQIMGLQDTDAEHGKRFKYRSIETDVLAHAMERVTGRRLAQLVSDELWIPMGAECDACFTVDSAGYALADGGFNATLKDFLRVGLLHLNEGRFGDRQIIPQEWIADIRRGEHGLFDDTAREMLPKGVYRNMFWIEDANDDTVMALGVFGQMIYIAPAYDMVVVKLSSWPDFIDLEHKANTLRACHAIGRAFT